VRPLLPSGRWGVTCSCGAEIAALKAALDEARMDARVSRERADKLRAEVDRERFRAKVAEDAAIKARQRGRDEMLMAALQAIGQAPSGPTKAAVTTEIQNGHRALEKL
jgi:hypothetical protein